MITDPSIVDVVQFGPKEVAILGKQVGTTNVTLWFDDPDNGQTLNYVVTVVPDESIEVTRQMHYRDLERRIGQIFPGSKIDLLVVGKKVIVQGSAKDITEATRIYDLVKSQSGKLDTSNADNPQGQTVQVPTPANPMVVGGRASAPTTRWGRRGRSIPVPGVGMSAGPINPGGGVVDDTQNDNNSDANVVNMIEVPGEAQVMVQGAHRRVEAPPCGTSASTSRSIRKARSASSSSTPVSLPRRSPSRSSAARKFPC